MNPEYSAVAINEPQSLSGRVTLREGDRRRVSAGDGRGPQWQVLHGRTHNAGSQVRSLYVHIPFCEKKCSYCDFTSVAGVRGQEQYVEALRSEIHTLGEAMPGSHLDTIFFGGGTPSLIQPQLLASVMHEIRNSFSVSRDAEVSMEANPSSTSESRATTWLNAGINRVSVGVQSLESDILAFLDRVHGPDKALQALADVRAAGFSAINADLIYAVPGLDDGRWQHTLQRVLECDPGHLSCYELTVEDGTPLQRAVAQGTMPVVDTETALRQHWMAVEMSRSAGYPQYEISNFARPLRECQHNLAYWHNAFYAAAGVGAHGHLPVDVARNLTMDVSAPAVAVRMWHTPSVARYIAMARDGGLAVDGWEAIEPRQKAEETVMLGLRLNDGVEIEDKEMRRVAADLARCGLLAVDGCRVSVTTRGSEVLNQIVARLAGC